MTVNRGDALAPSPHYNNGAKLTLGPVCVERNKELHADVTALRYVTERQSITRKRFQVHQFTYCPSYLIRCIFAAMAAMIGTGRRRVLLLHAVCLERSPV